MIFLFSMLTSLLLTTVTSTVYTSAVRLNTVMGLSPVTVTGGEQVQPLLNTVTLILLYVSNSSHDTSIALADGVVIIHPWITEISTKNIEPSVLLVNDPSSQLYTHIYYTYYKQQVDVSSCT